MSDQRAHYALIACHVLWRELNFLTAQSSSVIYPVYLEQGLHQEPDRLRREVQKEIDRLDGSYDAILIGYGLCSNGICGLKAEKSRLVALRAHDCITLLLGSRERYQAYFDANPGTYWYSTGWIETTPMPGADRIALLRRQYADQYDEDAAEFLIEEELNWMKRYRQACFINQAELSLPAEPYRCYTQKCAGECGWLFHELAGDLQLLRDFLNGSWDNGRFLIVEPGQIIAPSYDSSVLTAQPAIDENRSD